jgi:hypothetical protein
MTKVFIGGSRRISRLGPEVRQRLDRIIERRLAVLVGDANGADKAVQEYLRGKHYELVEVFCSGDSCRNNTGHWPVRTIKVEKKKRDFSFYATKDRAMADEASVGFMLWDKESVGTLMNVLRLVRHNKKVVLFVAPDRKFIDVKDDDDWARLVASCARELRERVEQESSSELTPRETKPQPPTQASLF